MATAPQKPTISPFDTVYLDAASLRFEYEGENLTFVDADGTYYPRITLRRCYPLSAENTYVLVKLPDEDMARGQEIGIIRNLDDMEYTSKTAVMRELRLFYFVPVISRIRSIHEEFGFLHWYVDTDRGTKEFIMRDSIIGSVRQVSTGRWLIIDINQTRYEVHDFDALDHTSQELLQRYLLL
jgi:hypothetical protein